MIMIMNNVAVRHVVIHSKGNGEPIPQTPISGYILLIICIALSLYLLYIVIKEGK